MASKTVTREQAQRKKDQAAALMERIGDPDRASEFEGMTLDDYAEHRGLTLTNPYRRNWRNCSMATKADLQDVLDNIEDLLSNAYQPETSREEAMAAIGDALDQIGGDEDEDIDDEDNGDNGD